MAKPENKPALRSMKSGDAGEDQVQSQMDIDTEQGYHGETPDPTPNEAYTVAGVTSGMATPETDDALADEAEAKSETLVEPEH